MAVDRRAPPWPVVIATTLRLWLGRRGKMLGKLSRRHWAPLVLAMAFLVAGLAVFVRVSAGGFALAARHEATQGDRVTGAPDQQPAVGRAAALWVTRQVSRGAMVACDPGMCRVLRQQGFPAENLVILGSGAGGLRYCDLVVATGAVRSLVGSGLQRQDAPVVIASFGSGEDRVDVRAVAHGGGRAYQAALAADWAARRTAAAQLVKSPRVRAEGAARLDLLAGKVDSRLLITLAALAASYPVRVVMFGDSGPGASAGVPMRAMEIAGAGSPGNRHSEFRRIRSFVLMQHAVFRPARVSRVRLAPGGTVLLIEFGAPSPLGLLHGRPVNQ